MRQVPEEKSQAIATYYGNQAEAYDCLENTHFYTKLTQILCSVVMAEAPLPQALLEVGCGTGISTQVIKGCFPKAHIVAIDPTGHFLQRAEARLRSTVDFRCVSLGQYQHGEMVDVVIGNMCMHWLSRDERLALPLLLKPGGMAVFSLPIRDIAPDGASGNRWLRRAFRETMDRSAFKLVPRDWRGLSEGELAVPGLSTVFLKRLDITEELDPEAFLQNISTRGALLGLFGARAEAAKEWLRERLPEGQTLRLSWRVAVFGATKD